jgi:hypothetical protein
MLRSTMYLLFMLNYQARSRFSTNHVRAGDWLGFTIDAMRTAWFHGRGS